MADQDDVGPEDLAYAPAMAELEQLLLGLERSDLDVDRLAVDVARAATLIRICRGRIGAARLEVRRIVADLEPDDEPTDDEPGDEGDLDADGG